MPETVTEQQPHYYIDGDRHDQNDSSSSHDDDSDSNGNNYNPINNNNNIDSGHGSSSYDPIDIETPFAYIAPEHIESAIAAVLGAIQQKQQQPLPKHWTNY